MAEILIDEQQQLVRVTHLQDSLMTVDDVKRFNADVAQSVAVAAKRFGTIRLLIDVRKLSIQPPEVTQHFDKPDQLLRSPDDRYALILGSNLAKIQARRVLGDDSRICSFLTKEDAENWLLDKHVEGKDAPDGL